MHYARQLESTGVDGLELNVYAVATDLTKPGSEIEKELYEIVETVKSEIKVPIAIKVSPFYTSAVNVAAELDKRGADGLVLFNRFLQPTIEVDTESLHSELVLSTAQVLKLPLRWIMPDTRLWLRWNKATRNSLFDHPKRGWATSAGWQPSGD